MLLYCVTAILYDFICSFAIFYLNKNLFEIQLGFNGVLIWAKE